MERADINTQLEHMQAKYTGTGHADIDKHEFMTNQYRDTISTINNHHNMSLYIATADGVSVQELKYRQLQKAIQPYGPPPNKET